MLCSAKAGSSCSKKSRKALGSALRTTAQRSLLMAVLILGASLLRRAVIEPVLCNFSTLSCCPWLAFLSKGLVALKRDIFIHGLSGVPSVYCAA